MLVTLDIDDDVLDRVAALAAALEASPGRVLSDLARQALAADGIGGPVRNGVPVLPRRRVDMPRPTDHFVNGFRDDE